VENRELVVIQPGLFQVIEIQKERPKTEKFRKPTQRVLFFSLWCIKALA